MTVRGRKARRDPWDTVLVSEDGSPLFITWLTFCHNQGLVHIAECLLNLLCSFNVVGALNIFVMWVSREVTAEKRICVFKGSKSNETGRKCYFKRGYGATRGENYQVKENISDPIARSKEPYTFMTTEDIVNVMLTRGNILSFELAQ